MSLDEAMDLYWECSTGLKVTWVRWHPRMDDPYDIRVDLN